MLVLGVSGCFSSEETELLPNLPTDAFHDAAACLIRDGKTIAAVEEERFNRIKKTTKFPVNAIRACLDIAGASPRDIDAVGHYFQEAFLDRLFSELYVGNPGVPVRHSRELITERLRDDLAIELPPGQVLYIEHHISHAVSCFLRSGMDEALVVVMDGRGEAESATIFHGHRGELTSLATYNVRKSLGIFYQTGTEILGYGLGDEYKVMGLAPYGDPATYRDLFSELYTLKEHGDYELRPLFRATARGDIVPRRQGEEFTQRHKDFAAALQETLEKLTLHVLGYWAERTGLRNLCFVGGVAHNSTLNGLILRSGMFRQVFVHPASHDAGSAEGAALATASRLGAPVVPGPRMRNASLGPALGSPSDIEKRLGAWSDLVEYERLPDTVGSAAALLAGGAVLGWAQGPSEFGPRALGNRSILADARPARNRDRINAMVKKRESYRPFAPVVIPEAASTYFEIPPTAANYDFMSFVVDVRAQHRPDLGAVTHVDGSARIQIVDPVSNARFYDLVKRFGQLTGTPVLLNTSFNNNSEPIVQSVDDVVTCFLTTELDFVIVEDFLLRRRASSELAMEGLVLLFRPVTRLEWCSRVTRGGARVIDRGIYLDQAKRPSARLSPDVFALLEAADGTRTLDALAKLADGKLTAETRQEIYDLWQRRFFQLLPEPL
jgi:predicted NodU family carbamoyl transferase